MSIWGTSSPFSKANRRITSEFRDGPGLAVRPGDICEAVMEREPDRC
jgi:hypothetical protein